MSATNAGNETRFDIRIWFPIAVAAVTTGAFACLWPNPRFGIFISAYTCFVSIKSSARANTAESGGEQGFFYRVCVLPDPVSLWPCSGLGGGEA